MGDILYFEPRRSGKVLRKRGVASSGVVIIFSGVRYERLTGTNAKARDPGKLKQSLTNPSATPRSL